MSQTVTLPTITHAPTTPALPSTLELPTAVAPTCPSCQSHNVTNGHCGDCNLTDDASAFLGGGMTSNACFKPSRFGKSGGKGRTFDSSPRGWTISGRVD